MPTKHTCIHVCCACIVQWCSCVLGCPTCWTTPVYDHEVMSLWLRKTIRPWPRSHQVQLRVGWKILLLCVSTVQHAQYGEIERGSGFSEENFQVAVVEGGRGSQRRFPQRLDVFKASGTETNLLGNQQWRLHPLQSGAWEGDEHRDIWSAPTSNSRLVRQRWQRNLESNSTQSTEGSEWDQILRKSLKQEENRDRLPILAGL